MRAGIGSAHLEFRLAFELVRDRSVASHLAGVLGGGFAEDGVQAKWRKPLIGACFIRSGEEILLGDAEVVLWGEGVLSGEIGNDRRQREGRDDDDFCQ